MNKYLSLVFAGLFLAIILVLQSCKPTKVKEDVPVQIGEPTQDLVVNPPVNDIFADLEPEPVNDLNIDVEPVVIVEPEPEPTPVVVEEPKVVVQPIDRIALPPYVPGQAPICITGNCLPPTTVADVQRDIVQPAAQGRTQSYTYTVPGYCVGNVCYPARVVTYNAPVGNPNAVSSAQPNYTRTTPRYYYRQQPTNNSGPLRRLFGR